MDIQEKQEMQALIQSEIQRYMVQKQYAVSKIPNHVHNGSDAPKISQNNIIRNTGVTGSVTFSAVDTYSLGLPSNPRFVSVEGMIVDTLTGAPDRYRVFTQGKAVLGGGVYMQPGTNRSTIVDPRYAPQPIIQSASSILTDDNSGTTYYAQTSEGNIVFMDNPVGTVIARLTSYNDTELIITVISLPTNWRIEVNVIAF